jgi:pimeloyl-ACP methyl ester carboxylesterase
MTEREMTAAGPPRTPVASAVVLVLHGGRSASRQPTTAVQLAVLRMRPVAAAVGRAVSGSATVVCRPRFPLRGWNGAQAAPVSYLAQLLEQIPARYGQVPVVLIGHSMGARAALRIAGHPLVTAVGALAPWLPAGEPVSQLAGRRVLLAHGTADQVTSPPATWRYADQAAAVPTARVTAIAVRGGDHAMLRRAGLWHDLAAEFTRAALGLPPGNSRLRDTLDHIGAVPAQL